MATATKTAEWPAKLPTEGCSRCGGSGHYSFNYRDGTTCLKCGGSGKQVTRTGNKWLAQAVAVETAKAGDYMVRGINVYRVTAVRWVASYVSPKGTWTNQHVHAVRLADGTEHTFRRAYCYSEECPSFDLDTAGSCNNPAHNHGHGRTNNGPWMGHVRPEPTPEMIGQEVSQ